MSATCIAISRSIVRTSLRALSMVPFPSHTEVVPLT